MKENELSTWDFSVKGTIDVRTSSSSDSHSLTQPLALHHPIYGMISSLQHHLIHSFHIKILELLPNLISITAKLEFPKFHEPQDKLKNLAFLSYGLIKNNCRGHFHHFLECWLIHNELLSLLGEYFKLGF